MKVKLIILIVFLYFVSDANSQNANPPAQPSTNAPVNAPFDLPNAIIYGNAQLSVGSSVKRFPNAKLTLSASELDSINSLEKEQSLLLPMSEMPKQIIRNNFKDGFLIASFGMFTDAKLDAGTSFEIENYNMHINGGFDLFGGHTDNAEYKKIFFNLSSDYVAPQKFWLFGGSKTTTTLKIKDNAYNTYGADSVAERKSVKINLDVDVDGNYEGFAFQTGMGLEIFEISQNIFTKDAFDNHFNGFLRIYNPPADWNIGLETAIDINNINANSISFINLAALISYVNKEFILNGKGGIILAANQFDETIFAPQIHLAADWKLDENYTLNAGFRTGLRKASYYENLMLNPYLALNQKIDFQKELMIVKTGLNYHSSRDFAANVKIEYGLFGNIPVWLNNTQNGYYDIAYLDGSIMNIELETYYDLNLSTKLIANITYTMSNLDSSSKEIPYKTPIMLSLNYLTKLSKDFGTNIGVKYIGAKYADLANSDIIDGYFSINLHADYNLNEDFLIYADLDNLANQEIYIWKNYKERSLFASIGILWHF